jgi:hypothetical protein
MTLGNMRELSAQHLIVFRHKTRGHFSALRKAIDV